MQIVFGNLWDAPEGYVIAVTTNAVIKRDGALVMGMGAASQLAERAPAIPKIAGLAVDHTCGSLGRYGWITVTSDDGTTYGLFQTKRHYEHPSTIDLIAYSAERLYAWQRETGRSVALNFPGIGLGRLNAQEVYNVMDGVFGGRGSGGPDLALYSWPVSRNEAARLQARRWQKLHNGVGRTR